MKTNSGFPKEKVLEGTFILISVVVVYILSQIPYFIMNLLREIKTANHKGGRILDILNIVGDSAGAVNASINFFLYCIVGKQYRKYFKKAFEWLPAWMVCWKVPSLEGNITTITN